VPIYEKTFVLYQPIDKWGSFDEAHYGMFPTRIPAGARADRTFSFVDSTGHVRIFNLSGNREIHPITPTSLFLPSVQRPVVAAADGSALLVSSTGRLKHGTVQFARAGYYSDGGPTPIEVRGLDSMIRIGHIRPLAERSPDDMAEVIGVAIMNVLSGPANQFTDDYAIITSGTADEDYLVVSGLTDFGPTRRTYIDHGLRVLSSVDGSTYWAAVAPDVAGVSDGVRYYTCAVVGVYHTIELTAIEVGHAIHLRNLELTATSAGRLM
jgi:hypothetical protein